VDGSHVAAGAIRISSTMGATVDSSSAVFGFTESGITLEGGHESMVSETWVAAYFWSQPDKERNNATGISVLGNDHFVTNVIVFSARTGIWVAGAANLISAHTWNCATGNDGIGILVTESQNRIVSAYLDFTDLKLTNAQQTSVSDCFFLGDAQLVFAAPAPASAVYGVAITDNVWYDCSLPAFAANETLGTWTSVTDLSITGTSFCGRGQGMTFPAATKAYAAPGAATPPVVTFDFSDVLLFPNVPIASVTASAVSATGTACAASVVNGVPKAGAPLAVDVAVAGGCSGQVIVSADQSTYSTWTKQA
jgi:hypothetical protein